MYSLLVIQLEFFKDKLLINNSVDNDSRLIKRHKKLPIDTLMSTATLILLQNGSEIINNLVMEAWVVPVA